MRRWGRTAALFGTAILCLLALPAGPAAASGRIDGTVQGGHVYPGAFRVRLMQALPGQRLPSRLASTVTRRGGAFTLRYGGTPPRRGVRYLIAFRRGGRVSPRVAVSNGALTLASALGAGRIPKRVTINERTTVAAAFSLAQFVGRRKNRISGPNPGLRNAAAMARNLVNPRTGRLAGVLRKFPNGRSTSTLATFNSLANLITLCRRTSQRCVRLLVAGRGTGEGFPGDTFGLLVSIARNPWHNVDDLFALSRTAPRLYQPALGRGDRPDAWTLALRFQGDGKSMNGPGNFAIDAGGGLWVTNNYEFSRKRLKPVCGAENLLRFTPTGRYHRGSPYTGGGLSGAGFGIGIDPERHVWVGNFGFAAPGCALQPPHNSVSEFDPNGRALSPDLTGKGTPLENGGYEGGGISWPQGTVSDRAGNIWIANCGNDTVTRYPGGNPEAAQSYSGLGLNKPFGVAVSKGNYAFVTGNESSTVAMIGPDGALARPPISGGGLQKPLGIAIDSRGYIWVANSAAVSIPCPGEGIRPPAAPGGGSVTLIRPDGEIAPGQPIQGAGLTIPWGIAVDGDDTVWVANFGGRRLSQLCGARPGLCPPGRRRTGASISPPGSGYGFDGLVRNTGLAIDPSGNVWLANNWKQVPSPANPGGYEIVAFLGLAAPIKTPLIGPPERP